MKPLLIAHRGDRVHFPENTFEAFESAFKLGADGVECDVHENDKGEIIIVHNYLYDRTKTYPSLKDFLKTFADKGRLEIELKTISSSFVKKVCDIILEINPPNYELTSSVFPLLPLVKQFILDATTGMIFKSLLFEKYMTEDYIPELLVNYLRLTQTNVLHLDLPYYTEKIIEKVRKNGFKLHTHLYNADIEDYKKAMELEVNQCTFDDITLLEKIKDIKVTDVV